MDKNALLKIIKEKKELAGLGDPVVEGQLQIYLNKHKINLENLNEKNAKILVKDLRQILRNFSGQYQKDIKNRSKYLKDNDFENLLKTHSSTAERLPYYREIKERIENLNISSILDLGCGLNPIALADRKIKYYASDIKEDELELIKSYFDKNKIMGKVFFYDLTKIPGDLPEADLCIIFKVLDIIPDKKIITNKILNTLNCRYFMISFSTKKLSGKKMNRPERKWFERILLKNKLKFEKFEIPNEVFYLIFKK